MLCPKCSNELPEGSAFCNLCGSNLNGETKDKKLKRSILIVIGSALALLSIYFLISSIEYIINTSEYLSLGKAIFIRIDDIVIFVLLPGAGAFFLLKKYLPKK